MRFWGFVAIVLVGVFAFVVGQRLSADAVGMAVGVLFGVLAGIPAALLVLASGRRRAESEFEDEDEEEVDPPYARRRGRHQQPYGALPAQAPVIVFAPPAATPAPQGNAPYGYTNSYVGPHPSQPALPGPTVQPADGRRSFKIVGEQEEWITEW